MKCGPPNRLATDLHGLSRIKKHENRKELRSEIAALVVAGSTGGSNRRDTMRVKRARVRRY
jgi:hypothetical protein